MTGGGFVHTMPVRYGECDAQGVVFNAHYLAFVDDAMDHWVRSGPEVGWTDGWDVMLKKAEIEWNAPLRWPAEVSIRPEVVRWGGASFDVRFVMSTGADDGGSEVTVATVIITYVSVDSRSGEVIRTPEPAREALSGAGADAADAT